MKSSVGYSFIATTLCTLITGCSTTNTESNTVSAVNTVSHSQTQEQDGQIISLTPIQDPQLGAAVVPYKMMYWSSYTKVEALITVPEGAPSTYPLLVSCHGGFARHQNMSHININGGLYTQEDERQLLASSRMGVVTVIPLYRGYGDSEGTVSSIYQNTLDTNNAIKAIMSKYSIDPKQIDLEGVSMGGFVVLQLASERKDIQSVVAISPFAGWNIVGSWARQNPTTPLGEKFSPPDLQQLLTTPNESVEINKIQAPVLLLQGENDTEVPWQTVQTLYNDMKSDNKNVNFILFPTGVHGLRNVQPKPYNDIQQWYGKIGVQLGS